MSFGIQSIRQTSAGIYTKNFGSSGVSDLLEKGDKALNENKFHAAANFYKQALNSAPGVINIYKKFAKAQAGLKNYASAEENYKIYLNKNKKDIDVIIELGQAQRKQGKYNEALNTFKRAYALDTSDDLARRCILETENNMLEVFMPAQARKEKEEYARKNLALAVRMTADYLTPDFMRKFKDVKIQFGETASMGGTPNIAQYENSKQAITVANSYIYAAPQVIAAYLTHESIHAHDNDPYTSIREEQDAYETAAKFWIENSNGIKDPEMDYAAELYKQSPDKLKSRVEEIYTLRDPYIAKTSPHHPPDKFFHWGKRSSDAAASGSIRTYDVIA